MPQFLPEDTWSALILESLVQCIAISILVKVNNELGNKALGRALLQVIASGLSGCQVTEALQLDTYGAGFRIKRSHSHQHVISSF